MLTAARLRRHGHPDASELSIGTVDARFALCGVVLLAVAVRLVGIATRLHNDDAYSWWVGSASSPHLFLSHLAASENSPPLFYLLLAPLPIDHPAWLRVPALVPGVVICLVLYGALRAPLGVRVALLASLATAVAPFLITYSNLARGFMLADLAMLAALWAIVKLMEGQSPARWMLLGAASAVALYTEYDSAIFLLAMTVAALWIGRPRARELLLAVGLSLVALIPWIPEMVRAQHQVRVTKLDPINGATSLRALRDAAVTLALGENGGTASPAGRWFEFVVILGLGVATATVIGRGWSRQNPPARRTIWLIAATAGLTLTGHAVAGAVGVQIFSQRYMTILIPLGAALAATALVSLERRPLLVAAVIALVAVGIVNLVRRVHGQFEPDLAPVRLAAAASHPHTVLTNTPLVLFYLRALHPRMDRAYNLGSGAQASCLRPCLVVDDSRVSGGTPRLAAGTRTDIGPYVLTLEP